MFCGEAKRSRRTQSLCKQEGQHVTSRCLLRATTHPLACSIDSSIKSSVSFSQERAERAEQERAVSEAEEAQHARQEQEATEEQRASERKKHKLNPFDPNSSHQ